MGSSPQSAITMSAVVTLLVAVATLAAAVVGFFSWRFGYWRRRGIPYVKPSIPFGNMKDAFLAKRPFHHVMHDLSKQFEGKQYGGIFIFWQPALVVLEVDVIKDVLVRFAHSHFVDHVAGPDPKKDPLLAKTLFSSKGKRWRILRQSLSPAFSSGKMKMMYPLVKQKGIMLTEKMEDIASQPDPKADMKLSFARFTTDVIASCAFGIEVNSLNEPDNQFLKMGLKTIERSFRHMLDTVVILTLPSLRKITRSIFVVKEVADFFRHLVWNVVNEREEKGFKRGDFIDLLIQLKNKGSIQGDDEVRSDVKVEEKVIPDSEEYFHGDSLVSHAFVFYFAGFETSSTAMNFALFELAANQDCQERLIEEIDAVLESNKGEITYETLHSMKYLDMVVSETLRKYPALAMLDRVCTQEYRNKEHDLVIPKGMHVLIPVYTIHQNPIHYPDPEKFDPERFSDEAKKNRPSFTYMPFGEGPRMCIGMRFGLMQVKVGLFSVLSKLRFFLPEEFKHMRSSPLDAKAFLISPDDSLRLIVKKRTPRTA
ncbi:hypothetical protein J437_LFUL016761 [Ladona fulva]|uniref:Cytochrome P450 n=1 Tax=Ladona fulva TaxID=123851 RepID=A0A8K0NS11_LADFU|nr:hypothetical protein J437_LFUL016761 [Ladona fulva]